MSYSAAKADDAAKVLAIAAAKLLYYQPSITGSFSQHAEAIRELRRALRVYRKSQKI